MASPMARRYHRPMSAESSSIGESVQRGMASYAADRGWFAPMEDDSADIGRWYRRAMGDAIADVEEGPAARDGDAERG